MSTTGESALGGLVRKYGLRDPSGLAAPPKDIEASPVYVVPVAELRDGHQWAADLFGFTTTDKTQVRVFDDNDWPDALRPFIPATTPNGAAWKWPERATLQLAQAFAAGDRVLLHGPTGAGKSALVEAFACVTRMPLIRVNCHREQQSTDFLGKDILKADPSGATVLEYDWSMTTLAARHGGILLIDEAFRSPALMSIQSLLERGGTLTLPDAASLTPDQRRIVPPDGKFLIALTDNTNGTGDESGAYNAEVQDLSTLDRITATIYVDYMSAAMEADILRSLVGPDVPDPVILDVVRWANKLRDAFKRGVVMQPVSLRATSAILRKYAVTGDLGAAVVLSYANKLGKTDVVVCVETWHQVTGRDLVL